MILHSLYVSKYLQYVLLSAAEAQHSTLRGIHKNQESFLSNHHEALATLTPTMWVFSPSEA